MTIKKTLHSGEVVEFLTVAEMGLKPPAAPTRPRRSTGAPSASGSMNADLSAPPQPVLPPSNDQPGTPVVNLAAAAGALAATMAPPIAASASAPPQPAPPALTGQPGTPVARLTAAVDALVATMAHPGSAGSSASPQPLPPPSTIQPATAAARLEASVDHLIAQLPCL